MGRLERRGWSGTALAMAMLVLLGAGLQASAPARAADPCPNEARRAEQGPRALALPACRAYELASPGSLVPPASRSARAAVSGGAVTYFTTDPAPSSPTSGYFYLARRGATGWTTGNVAPQLAPAALFEDECEQSVFLSPDLSLGIHEVGWFREGEPARCKRPGEPLVPGEPDPYRNVFQLDPASGASLLLNMPPAGVTPANAKFQDASDDFGRIVFSEEAQLTPEAPAASYNLFLWTAAATRLVTFLPDGTPAAGTLADAAGKPGSFSNGFAPATGAVSSDGRRIFFYAGGNLYLRLNADQSQSPVSAGACTDPQLACTVQVDASQGPGASGGGTFWRASEDGSSVLFTATSRLTPDSTAAAEKPDLYRYEVGSGELTDLTANPGEPATVRGVSGAGLNGEYAYFVADGVLAPGASPGNCKGGEGFSAQTCNLYVVHDEDVRFIATLSGSDSGDWQPTTDPLQKPNFLNATVSPSGRFLAFNSFRSLTGYDNHDAESPTDLDSQIFLYDAAAAGGAGQLSCVSCRPDGLPPSDGSVQISFAGNYAPSIPGGSAKWRLNVVTDEGSVFFETADPLQARDTNGLDDVYEYRDGQPRLISSGTYPGQARLRDVSPSGSDVFFTTAEGLVGSDLDHDNTSLYDARVGGGFPEPPLPPPACDEETCRGPLPAPPQPSGSPATSTFVGPETGRKQKPKKGKRARCRKAPRAKATGRKATCKRAARHVKRNGRQGGRR